MAGEKKIVHGKHTYGGGCKRRSRKYYKVDIHLHDEVGEKPSDDKEMSHLEKRELSEKDENNFEEGSDSDISDLKPSHGGGGFRNLMR